MSRSGAGHRATLREVAALAGVSTSTASLVFSGKGPVAPATARRVREAADHLAFTGPDPLASSLRQGRVGTVAVVVESPLRFAFRDPFALAVLDGLAEELEAAGRSMLLVAQPAEHPGRAVDQLATLALDAAVLPLCGVRDNPVVDHLAARRVPLVGSGSPLDPRVVHVRTDEEGAIGLTTRHVIGLGHTRLAHVTMALSPGASTAPVAPGGPERADYPDAEGRLRGFRKLAGERAPVVEAADLTVGAGEQAGRLLLDVPSGRRPTAVVCQADLLAAGVLRAAAALHLRVPEDVSVTGFDGVDLPWLDHTLTTVLQPGVAKGAAMGALVRRALAGEPVADEAFPVRLRVGSTTGPAPAG
ncbi:substrate-binding domain-containing protein [Phycicoccus endophyticus]|uniref:Substrate-binding domain-containing protein n=1 Tax=Phycicoccus endophyticus TaxID=1690220 RepID=A0A7G9R3K8_9MICO|nr:substrate-binding domain-containing protein [Phycicoccus endophyticus]NHI19940.1 substrate-binding domain-containing protein [Phycicoccus endophyticus]QNN50183.1 substrate-binding domain-containing protein [Phycicoccus endophyticus]GGL27312.1 transcriptional regulator [Phycicoccus endophyticus]